MSASRLKASSLDHSPFAQMRLRGSRPLALDVATSQSRKAKCGQKLKHKRDFNFEKAPDAAYLPR